MSAGTCYAHEPNRNVRSQVRPTSRVAAADPVLMGFFKRTEAPIEAKDGMKRLTATDVVAKAPQWCTDPRFRDDSSRADNGAAISERMAAWSADRSSAEALGALERAGIR